MADEGRNPAIPRFTDEGVLERLRQIARDELEMKPDDLARLGPETLLVEGLQLDSLRQVVLITSLEEEFGFELGYEDGEHLQALRTLGGLVQLIQERANRESAWS